MKKFTAAVAAAFAAVGIVLTPTADAATVISVEGTLQPSGKTQTAFNGGFCQFNTCRPITNRPINAYKVSDQIQTAIESTPGEIVVMAWSLGASSVFLRQRAWEADPSIAPDPARVTLVTFGNPKNALGGKDTADRLSVDELSPYKHLEVIAQYDNVADVPARWGWYSQMNLKMAQHHSYYEDVDINDPDNLVWSNNGTTYMLIKADVLPMLRSRDWYTSDKRMAELDAKYRPLIEKDYDRPPFVPQGPGANWTGAGNVQSADVADGKAEIEAEEEAAQPQSRGSRSGSSRNSQKTEQVEVDESDNDDGRASVESSIRADEQDADKDRDVDANPGRVKQRNSGNQDQLGDRVASSDSADSDAGDSE